MEYLTCYVGLEHYGAHLMCPWCEASSLEPDHPLVISGIYASTPWNDFRADADWRQTSWNRHPVASWIASHPIRHPLFALPGVSIQTIMPDHLHICDLGVFQRIIGNLLFGMVFDRMVPGADTKSRVQAAWYMIEGEYVNLRISQRISGLTLSMFCNEKKIHGSQPSLRGVKAAETRWLLPAVVSAFEKLASDSDEHRLAVRCGRCACGYLDTMQNIEGHVPTPEEASDIRRFVFHLTMSYSALRWSSYRRGLVRWGLTPKFHFLCHLADMCSYSNPRNNWTYMDEDFMGIMKKLVKGCFAGTKFENVQVKTAVRWALAYDLSCAFHDL